MCDILSLNKDYWEEIKMKICPDCGAEMRDADLFCTNCGQKYTAPEQPQTAETDIAEAEQPKLEAEEPKAEEAAPEEMHEEAPEGKPEIPASAPLIISPESGEQSTKSQDEKRTGTKYSAPAYQTQAPAYQHEPIKDPVRMSEWLVNMIVLAVPIVNIIVALIWAFGSDTKPSLKNFSRAWLIWAIIGTIIAIALGILIGVSVYNTMYAYTMPGGGFYGYY